MRVEPAEECSEAFIADLRNGFSWTFPVDTSEFSRRRELVQLDELIGLRGKRVLEPACFEGYWSVAMAQRGADVTAFDPRPISLCKAFARAMCSEYDGQIKLTSGDARNIRRDYGEEQFDLLFHAGLLYHLSEPAAHMRSICGMFPHVLLETHVVPEVGVVESNPNLDTECSEHEGFTGRWYHECGWADAVSGLEEQSFWLTERSILRLFDECRLRVVTVLAANDDCMYGPRRCYLLERI